MHGDVAILLFRKSDSTTVGECHLALTCETTEDRDNMFRSLVRLVDDDDTPKPHGPQERRVGVLDDPGFKRGRVHQLSDSGVPMELDILSWSTKELLGGKLQIHHGKMEERTWQRLKNIKRAFSKLTSDLTNNKHTGLRSCSFRRPDFPGGQGARREALSLPPTLS